MWKSKVLMLFFILVLLTGCWDERLLRDIRTVYLSGFDVNAEGDYKVTSLIRNFSISNSERGERSVSNILVTAEGQNIREASLSVDRNIAGTFDPAKGRALILGEAVGKEDIYNVLDSIYRDPRVNVNSKIAITDKSAHELIQHLVEEEMEKAEYFYDMISSSEDSTETPNITIRNVFSYLFNEGTDFFIPYFTIDPDENKVRLQGTALFHGQSFTGQFLSVEQSTLLLLFMDQRSKKAILTDSLEESRDASISYNVTDVSRKLSVEKNNKIHINISLQLDIDVVDFPERNLDKTEIINQLNEQLSNQLTAKAEVLFQLLADNKSDVLGLGRELIAFHPSIWEDIKGEDYYDQIVVKPEVKVNIISSGIIL